MRIKINADHHVFEVEIFLNDLDPKAVSVELYADGINGGIPVRQEMKRVRQPTGASGGCICDDEDSLLKLAKKRLEMQGYQVEAKSNPVEALELFRSEPDRFDLIITDMTMPKMTGDKLAKELLNIRPEMPIILCSGYSDRIDIEKAAALGIRKYIEKPPNMSDFLVSIRKMLDESKNSAQG